jgi:hypothetical protein
VLWTVNDSGDAARIYGVGPNGRTRGGLRVAGLKPRDWEALAAAEDGAGRPVLWVGDIGDNQSARERGILVHRVVEPEELRDDVVRPTSYRLVYPDGPHDAETLLVDPRTGRLSVVTKDLIAAAIYTAPERLDPVKPNVLERVADASRRGDRWALRRRRPARAADVLDRARRTPSRRTGRRGGAARAAAG